MELYRPHGKNHLTNDDAWSWLKKAALPLVVAGASVVAAPLVLSAAGFGAGGIVAGSLAAKGMSAIAMSNGVGVAAGELNTIHGNNGGTDDDEESENEDEKGSDAFYLINK
ncbi:hypothetical protein MAR_006856 [Mya arenaria]|uniref:Uncharacterized protein n=1 Tax=Mya arenaria TaxID=6604 RepID=A0ABY7DHA3_MYAAR|nr:hypothetical protein MAR_006856 [Mya arenaria]